MDPADLAALHSYRPHFMHRRTRTTTITFGGVDYYYVLAAEQIPWFPNAATGIAGTAAEYELPVIVQSLCDRPQKRHLALLFGNYHYFFSCSDDSITFEDGAYCCSGRTTGRCLHRSTGIRRSISRRIGLLADTTGLTPAEKSRTVFTIAAHWADTYLERTVAHLPGCGQAL